MFILPQPIRDVLSRLENAGYEAYIVGGCVRDYLLGAVPKDYDVTTSALPTETEEVFRGYRVIETGLQHGTVTVLSGGMPVEITTYRVDGEYADNRHPSSVAFARSLREDAARRDFTMNAIAYGEREGLRDFFGGEGDIQSGLIRCIGDADTRFQEDALRILRALRFSSTLGFRIENGTAAALLRRKGLLKNVSAERVAAELLKLLCGRDAARVLIDYADALAVVLPEIAPMRGFDQRNIHHIYDVWEHTAHAVQSAEPMPVLRLAALCHDMGKPCCFTMDSNGVGHFYGHAKRSAELADTALRRLKLDNQTREEVVRLVEKHDVQIEKSEKAVRRAISRLSPEGFFRLIQLKRADNFAQNPAYRDRQKYLDELEDIARRVLSEKQCFALRDLAVKGDDLLALGVAPGKRVGELLQALLDGVIDGTLPNERDALLGRVKDGDIESPLPERRQPRRTAARRA